MDQALEKVEALQHPKITCHYQDGRVNMGQFTRLVNEIILPGWERPDTIFLIEPDQVMKGSEIVLALEEFRARDIPCATTRQVELWKTPDWAIPMRSRSATVFWNLHHVDQMPPTARAAEPLNQPLPELTAITHNFGFCISWNAMFWKHVLALAFSAAIGDSIPAEDWLVETWTKWDPIANNKDLEISARHRHFIPSASPYDRSLLPELIRKKYGYA
ncbi:MAG: hypothetical protein H7840_08070 [Alphaproteobacteria bacterium]